MKNENIYSVENQNTENNVEVNIHKDNIKKKDRNGDITVGNKIFGIILIVFSIILSIIVILAAAIHSLLAIIILIIIVYIYMNNKKKSNIYMIKKIIKMMV